LAALKRRHNLGDEMTANELADLLETTESTNNKAAAMLRQFGLAESIIKQQQLEIQALKDEVAEWKMSYENCHRMCSGYGMN
jgi:hypothetical protein